MKISKTMFAAIELMRENHRNALPGMCPQTPIGQGGVPIRTAKALIRRGLAEERSCRFDGSPEVRLTAASFCIIAADVA